MATTLPPLEVLSVAAAELSQAARDAGDRANMHALDKAAMQLHAGCVPVATTGGYLVESRTRGGLVHRVSAVGGCSCESGRNQRPCWHQSLIEILEVAQQRAVLITTHRKVTKAEAMAAIDELFS
jgi:hypothetical protein